ncbi:MAG: cation:proton antiporter [Burkholderiales bacterium]|jgi:CPA2 family monovalent cation:H+ antiporter-2|nr:cation:proton antiporter [Burkholderiales bacterium]
MHAANFIQDLAIVMLIAGVMTLLFRRLKQPVVLGYILAGMIIGPYIPPFQLINDKETIDILAELGIIFLLFTLGLEFTLKKLASVGFTALFGALAEVVLMMWAGYSIAMFFGWGVMNGIFLGAMLSVSSTTIIIKVLDDLKMKHERFAQLIFGILIFDDILAIGMIALLSSIAITGQVGATTILGTLGKLSLFMVAALVLGILVVPRLLNYVARFKSDEMLLITVLALCFGFCLIVIKLDYSVALGAFVMGAIMAESRHIPAIERVIAPIRDMFSAIFFVAIGLLFDPHVLLAYALPIALITVVVVFGKLFACGAAAFIAGNGGRTSMRVGMGLSQIGEFSFIIAALGQSLKVTGDFLYPIAVAVSAVTSFLTPYLIKWADPLTRKLSDVTPARAVYIGQVYATWLQSIQPQGDRAQQAAIIRRIVFQAIINLALVTVIFMSGHYLAPAGIALFESWGLTARWGTLVIWLIAVLLSLPCLLAAYGKLKALSIVLAQASVSPVVAGRYAEPVRRVVAELIPLMSVIGFLLLVVVLSTSILPTTGQLILMLASIFILGWLLRGRFLKMHARLQAALIETLKEKADEKGDTKPGLSFKENPEHRDRH